MVYLVETSFVSNRRVKNFGIEINPHSHPRTVKISLSLTPHSGQLVGGDTDLSINWGELFYRNLAGEIETLGYQVSNEILTVENTGDNIKDYQLSIEFNGKQVASCGQVEMDESVVVNEGELGIPRTLIIPTFGSISFYVRNRRLFGPLLNGLIQNPYGVIGQRYRLALQRSGKHPEEIEDVITDITQLPENKPHFYLQGSIERNL